MIDFNKQTMAAIGTMDNTNFFIDTLLVGLPLRQHATVDVRDAVEATCELFGSLLQRVARRMTRDEDEQQDLVQEAEITLWLIDPTRFDLRDPTERRYLRQLLVRRMWRVWARRRERYWTMTEMRAAASAADGTFADEREDELEDGQYDQRDGGLDDGTDDEPDSREDYEVAEALTDGLANHSFER